MPVLVLVPASPRPTVVIWVSPNGKQGILAEDGKPIPVIRKMLEQKLVVVTADLFGQGETTPDGKNVERQRLVRDDYAGYTFGYNPPLYAQRVHDLLKVIRFARSQLVPEGKLIMIGPQGAAHWVAGALAQAKGAVDLTVVDTGGFRFQSINAFDHPDFFPGAAKYLDLPGLLSIAAPAKLWLAGENSEGLSLIRRVYHAAPAEGQLRAWDSLPMDENSEWLKSLIESL